MVEQRLIHGRHARHCRNLITRNRFQCLFRIETRQHNNLSASVHRPVEHRAIGEDMEKGQHAH